MKCSAIAPHGLWNLTLWQPEKQILCREVESGRVDRQMERARALLLAADGVANTRIASDVGVTAMTVRSWRSRFETQELTKFAKVAPGRGRTAMIPREVTDKIVDLAQNSTPVGETHWTRGLKPHLVKTFKLSNDPRFEEKLIDVVGLCLNPPDNAVVLCMDELCEASHNSSDVKSSVQALDGTSRRCRWSRDAQQR